MQESDTRDELAHARAGEAIRDTAAVWLNHRQHHDLDGAVEALEWRIDPTGASPDVVDLAVSLQEHAAQVLRLGAERCHLVVTPVRLEQQLAERCGLELDDRDRTAVLLTAAMAGGVARYAVDEWSPSDPNSVRRLCKLMLGLITTVGELIIRRTGDSAGELMDTIALRVATDRAIAHA